MRSGDANEKVSFWTIFKIVITVQTKTNLVIPPTMLDGVSIPIYKSFLRLWILRENA